MLSCRIISLAIFRPESLVTGALCDPRALHQALAAHTHTTWHNTTHGMTHHSTNLSFMTSVTVVILFSLYTHPSMPGKAGGYHPEVLCF